jgi:ComF family protein
MVDFMKNDADITAGIDLLTFVPQSPGRLHKKGFNQSEMLVSNLSGAFGIPVIDALEKSRITKNQNELSRQERLINLIGAFRVKNSRAPSIKDKRILLIDDVMTTGATLNECAKTLLGGGAKEARCMTLARGA